MIVALGERVPQFDQKHTFIADNATVIGDVLLRANVSVWFQAVIRADNDRIEVGAGSNVQDGAVLHTDPAIPLQIGAGVTIGHRAVVHGCKIGDSSLIGIGSIVMNHATIGQASIVGANSLVTEGKSFPDGVLIMGSPAQVVRELSPDERKMVGAAAASYVKKIALYQRTQNL